MSNPTKWKVRPQSESLLGWLTEMDELLDSSRNVRGSKSKRIYDRDGYLIKCYRESTFGRWFLGPRAWREWNVMQEVERRGVAVHPILAIGDDGERSVSIYPPLGGWLRLDWRYRREPRRRSDLATLYGEWVRRMHDVGIDQYDCNPTNVLERDGTLIMLDFERVQFGRVDDITRYDRLGRMARIGGIERTDTLRFIQAYAGADWKAALRGVDEVRRRVLTHDAERLVRKCQREGRTWGVCQRDGWRGYYRKPDEETGEWGTSPDAIWRWLDEGLGRSTQTPRETWVQENIEWLWGKRQAPPLAVVWSKPQRQGKVFFLNR